MGGYGSGQWKSINRRTTVEECLSIKVSFFLSGSQSGEINWLKNKAIFASLNFAITRQNNQPTEAALTFTIAHTGEVVRYTVLIVSTSTSWGTPRFWFVCPNTLCKRRVGKLYLPPNNASHFLCRYCYKLTYASSQESHKYRSLFKHLATQMPGINETLVRVLLTENIGLAITTGLRNGKKLTKKQKSKLYKKYRDATQITNEDFNPNRLDTDRWQGYLSKDSICDLAGLSSNQMELLYHARLLVPDHEGLYRPKLAGWATKLAFLLQAGWEVNEICCWSTGRWNTSNPRAWPPEHKDWQGNM